LNNGTQFTIFDTAGVTNVSWNFGDPVSGAANTATGLNVMHVFSQSGLYNVTAVVTGSCGNDTLLFGGLFIYACNSTYDGVILFTPDSCLQSNISFSLSNINNITNAAWNFGDPGSGVNNTSVFINPSHIFSDTGTYTITCIVTVNCGPPMFPCFFTDTVYKTIRIVDCNVPCDGSISSVGDSCLQSVVAFSVSGSQPVLNASWNFDDPASGNANASSAVNPTHVFSDTGIYTVRCIVEFSCGTDTVFKAITVVDCDSLPAECKIFVPNAFTPNADNLNDKFSPIVNCPVDLFEFSIYNRWGQQVFRSTDPAVSWNGKYQGAGCPIGAYVYLINYKFPSQRKKQLKGSVMLLK
jgi:gliding motility-associated-like protein